MTPPKWTNEPDWCRAIGIPDMLDVARYGNHLACMVRCEIAENGVARRISAPEPAEPGTTVVEPPAAASAIVWMEHDDEEALLLAYVQMREFIRAGVTEVTVRVRTNG